MTIRGSLPDRSIPLAFQKVCGARARRAISWLARRTFWRSAASSMETPQLREDGKRLPNQFTACRDRLSVKANEDGKARVRAPARSGIFRKRPAISEAEVDRGTAQNGDAT